MRNYYIDELDPEALKRFAKHLKNNGFQGSLEDIYWLEVPHDLLTEEQADHFESCGPYVMTLECGPEWINLELLVRARSRLRCSCIAYAEPEQRAYAVETVDTMLKELDIPV
ncbi:hypothetical protein [Desulfohalobium retbaense]|uniref:Uncharacterized protein n=1 Tax=Desulfohalobium retbaense (strain ATCC 49708 / DSM 5692 / JCM 16813 / HR100) TaxID=485915 RepID=C8X2V6_DESRD|nr:hypothetical protein [Desulfohalobium retbaense]ACV68753.1 conserved hypothetical protein [Desulfohalobium retbaense DSM 5692]